MRVVVLQHRRSDGEILDETPPVAGEAQTERDALAVCEAAGFEVYDPALVAHGLAPHYGAESVWTVEVWEREAPPVTKSKAPRKKKP